jgi:hypothetical protein
MRVWLSSLASPTLAAFIESIRPDLGQPDSRDVLAALATRHRPIR